MNKVIIIGGSSYHNSLNLARVFFENGIKSYGILVRVGKSDFFDNQVVLSKCWKKTWLVENEEKAIQFLCETFDNETEMPVIVPSSDGAALAVDNCLDILKTKFIVPGICQKQGEIARLMNKFKQIGWANSLGIEVAKAEIVNLTVEECQCPSLNFPIILKPVLSAEGKKQDIRKCNTISEFNSEICLLKNKGYKRILAQEFVIKDYEMELFGSITNQKNIYLLTKHYREWPKVGGTVCYHEFITDSDIQKQAKDILEKIKQSGFRGNIDIELFMVGRKIMLNEVNFRNSGDLYACFANKVYYPYYSFLDMIGYDISMCNCNYHANYTAMEETSDIRHFIFGSLKLKQWLKDWKRCADFAYWHKGDIKPAIARYIYVLTQVFSRGKDERNKK